MVTRRRFLSNCCSVTALTALTPAFSINAMTVAGRNLRSLDSLSYHAFASQVNTTFRLRLSEARTVSLRLVEARSKSPVMVGTKGTGNVALETFSLIFLNPSLTTIDPRIHQFEHDTLGQFDMYIGGVDRPGPKGAFYESIFNRPVKSDIAN